MKHHRTHLLFAAVLLFLVFLPTVTALPLEPDFSFDEEFINISATQNLVTEWYVPFDLWLIVVIIALICFFSSIWLKLEQCSDISAALAALLFAILAITSNFVSRATYEVVPVLNVTENATQTAGVLIIPINHTFPTTWFCLIWLIMFLVSVVNLYRIRGQALIDSYNMNTKGEWERDR